MDVICSGKPDQAIAQILPIEQNESEHEDHDSELHQRVGDEINHADERLKCSEARILHFDRNRARNGLLGSHAGHRSLKFRLQFPENAGGAIHYTGTARCELQRPRLLAQCRFIGRKIGCKAGQCPSDKIGRATEDDDGHGDHEEDGHAARQTGFLQNSNDRRQKDSQQQCENGWNDDLLAEVENGTQCHKHDKSVCRHRTDIAGDREDPVAGQWNWLHDNPLNETLCLTARAMTGLCKSPSLMEDNVRRGIWFRGFAALEPTQLTGVCTCELLWVRLVRTVKEALRRIKSQVLAGILLSGIAGAAAYTLEQRDVRVAAERTVSRQIAEIEERLSLARAELDSVSSFIAQADPDIAVARRFIGGLSLSQSQNVPWLWSLVVPDAEIEQLVRRIRGQPEMEQFAFKGQPSTSPLLAPIVLVSGSFDAGLVGTDLAAVPDFAELASEDAGPSVDMRHERLMTISGTGSRPIPSTWQE